MYLNFNFGTDIKENQGTNTTPWNNWYLNTYFGINIMEDSGLFYTFGKVSSKYTFL